MPSTFSYSWVTLVEKNTTAKNTYVKQLLRIVINRMQNPRIFTSFNSLDLSYKFDQVYYSRAVAGGPINLQGTSFVNLIPPPTTHSHGLGKEFKNMMNWGEQYSELNNTTEIKRLSLKESSKCQDDRLWFLSASVKGRVKRNQTPLTVWKIHLILFHVTKRTSFQQFGWAIPQKQNLITSAYGAFSLCFGL